MYTSNDFASKAYYSLELKHQICKDHIENGLRLKIRVKKYNLSCHSLVHVWLRQLGYKEGTGRRKRSVYIGVENFQTLPDKHKKKQSLTPEQQQIEFLEKEPEDDELQAEG